MEVALIIITGLSVCGLTALGIISQVLGTKERERLHKMIKAENLVEYVSMTQPEDEEEKEVKDVEVDIDDIPFLDDSGKE